MKGRRILALVLLACLILSTVSISAAAAEDDAIPGYVISGQNQRGQFTLIVSAEHLYALSGRLGLLFDTEKLELVGGDSLSAVQAASGISLVAEVRPESEMVNGARGQVNVAWYSNGLDALSQERQVFSVQFRMKSGVGINDIDSSTFRLRAIEFGEFGEWKSAASFQGRGSSYYPVTYEYLASGNPMNVRFTYPGNDRAPSRGITTRYEMKDLYGQPVAGTITVNGRRYQAGADGTVEVLLSAGEYIYQADANGYGIVRKRVNISDSLTEEILMISDSDLVKQAQEALVIGYRTGDHAEHVTNSLELTYRTEAGVTINWVSSHPRVVTKEGGVYLPENQGVWVTLTATLSKGSAKAEKTFRFYVCSKAELRPGGEGKFTDLGNYGWARDSIEEMAQLGIIRGTSETKFSPGSNIKRGDFVLLLMRMISPAGTAGKAFDDVPADSYYYQAIAQARVLGIAQGTGDNRFHPESPITRQEMATFVVRAMEKTGYVKFNGAQDNLQSFSDRNLVAGYALESMRTLVGNGMLKGSNGRLNPLGNTTRAEAATLIARIYHAH